MPSAGIGIMASSVVTSAGIVVATTNSEVGTTIGTGTGNAIPSPTGIAVGDLLIGIAAIDTSLAAPAASAGWTSLVNATSTANGLRTWARIADGTASDNLSIGASGDSTQDYCAMTIRITGHSVTSATLATAIASNFSNGTSATPDPQPVTSLPSATRLWLTAVAVDRSATLETITAMPASYTQVGTTLVSSATATSLTMAVAQRTLTGTAEDPGTFTASASRPWVTHTLGIPQ